MLTDDDLVADLARLRERSAGIVYTGEVPLTRRSATATIVPVAAVAAVATLGAMAVVGDGDVGPGAGASSGADEAASSSAGPGLAGPVASGAGTGAIELVSAEITLGGKTIAYRHAPGADPFGGGWQLAIEFGSSVPADATRFDLGNGELVWVAGSPDPSAGTSVLIVAAGPRHSFYGAPSDYSRADLEEFVRSELGGQ
jgi:hypothetical protein